MRRVSEGVSKAAQSVREHPVVTTAVVGALLIGATIATGGAAAPALAAVF